MTHATTDSAGPHDGAGDDAENPASDASGGETDPDSTGPPATDYAGSYHSRRVVVGYALLFSIPVGIGVAVMLLKVTAGWPTDPLVFGPSLLIAAAVFLLLVVVGGGGSPES